MSGYVSLTVQKPGLEPGQGPISSQVVTEAPGGGEGPRDGRG